MAVWVRATAFFALVLLLAVCSTGSSPPRPTPTITTEGANVHCSNGDHGLDHSLQFGWTFCYPGTWRFQERLQPSSHPAGVDDTFDIVNDLPAGQAGSGDFGFVIVGTYELGGASDLASWMKANEGGAELTPIRWGNAKDAGVDGQGRRFALTAHHVVELDARGSAIGQSMADRLSTWNFTD